MHNETFYLDHCQQLAEIAATRNESPVGSVVVMVDQMIGEGIEASKFYQDITYHAEVEAIRDAVKKHGNDLSGATLYTTHEPCILCSYVIRHHRISRVVIKKAVAHVGGATSQFPVLTTSDIPVWVSPPIVEFV
jgi:tRNA(adenine34) deaminase